ncbi:MAG: L,D-transpeptidase family protein [Candidatus Bruticola sp.]
MINSHLAHSRRGWSLGIVPFIAVFVSCALLILILIYFYKSGHFQIDSVSIDDLNLLTKSPKVGMRLSIANASPKLVINYSGLPSSPIQASVDGRNLPVHNDWLIGKTSAESFALDDGEHIFTIKSGPYDERWLINVDTIPPKVSISHPIDGYKSNKKKITLQGTTDHPGAIIKASIGDHTETAQANSKGFFCLTLPTLRGNCTIKWNVRDEAGNSTSGQRNFICDFEPPSVDIAIEQLPSTDKTACKSETKRVNPKDSYTIFTSKNLNLIGKASDSDSGIAKADIYIDGSLRQSIDYESMPSVKLSEEQSSDAEEIDKITIVPNNSESTSEPKNKTVNFTYKLPALFEGTHRASVVVFDTFGLSTKRTITFGLNSTDEYGQATLGLGAVGQDVAELQRRLVLRGYLHDDYTKGKYDKKTQEAVMELQAGAGLCQDGIAGVLVTSALSTRLYVNLSQYSLVLVDEANNTRYYTVAIGVDEHPTPTGAYFISDMAKDPVWLPPNSEWAKDAKQIPPGPDNPLGTRWIGFGDSLGFHGTPYPDTVGSKASHGCMRMTIPDIEDLYDRVNVGTQVCIFKGDEDSPILKRYWP